ncbi:hypothetical protein H8957_007888 [Semnopithecus entellus]
MLRSCPAVSLKEKSPAQPPQPPARRPNHCGWPLPPPPPPRLTNNPAMTSPSAASGSLRPPPLPQRPKITLLWLVQWLMNSGTWGKKREDRKIF